MMEPLPSRLAALEELAAAEPDSEPRRHDLLLEYLAFPALDADPRRLEHIRWFVEHHPRATACRSPIVSLHACASPTAFATIEGVWLQHLAASPDDPEIVMGFAHFRMCSDHRQACALLRSFVSGHPDAAHVWFELGSITVDKAERLACFLRARALGFEHPNLLAWIALLAAEAGDRAVATQVAEELLQHNQALREEYGDKLDWPETGAELHRRVGSVTDDKREAWAISCAIGAHAHDKHHAHTALGLIAVLDGKLDEAVEHLRESAEVGGDCRLSSYGPRFTLARALCEHARWDAVLSFLRRCETFWDDEGLPAWINDVERNVIPDAWSSDSG